MPVIDRRNPWQGSHYVGDGLWRVRKYRNPDFDGVVRLLTDAFVSSSSESVHFSLSAPQTAVLVAEARSEVVGVAMGIRFGKTGWVGSVVVSPDWQRKGVGSALTERAVESVLVEAHTVLLLALGPARLMYERLGFVQDGVYGTWVLPTGTIDAVRIQTRSATVAPMQQGDLERCTALDRRATGEDRRTYLELLGSHLRVLPAAAGSHERGCTPGYLAQLPWGAGPIIAENADAGGCLVRETLAANPRARIEFPDANEAGLAVVRELGLVRDEDDFRMRLGPVVPGFRPQLIYKVLTPAVG
jgi:predicted N-acetyltransferase YhbS